MISRRLALALACAAVLAPGAARAHWCDDLWVSNYNLVIRPVTDSVTVPSSGSATLDIYVQNNMGYPLYNFDLRASATNYNVAVTRQAPKVSGFLMPGEKLKHTLTISGAGGKTVAVTDLSFDVTFGSGGQSNGYPSNGGRAAMIRKTDGTLVPVPPQGISSSNRVRDGNAQAAHLLFSSQADYSDLSSALDGLMKQYCVGRPGWDHGNYTGPTTGLCPTATDASTYKCSTGTPDSDATKYDWQRLWSSMELAYRKSQLGARLPALRKGLQCGWNDPNFAFKSFAGFVLGYLGEDATARTFLEGIISSATANEKAVAKASLLLMGSASDSTKYHEDVVTCASSSDVYVAAICQASLAIADKDDAIVSSKLLPRISWTEPTNGSNGNGLFQAHLVALVAWNRRQWAPNAGDTGQVCFYENCGTVVPPPAAPPAAPGAATCTPTAEGKLRVSWPQVGQDENGKAVTGISYKVYYGNAARPAGATTPNEFPYSHSDATAALYRDYTGMDGSKTFYFSVVAVDAAGLPSKYSKEVSCIAPYTPVAKLVCDRSSGMAPLAVSCSATTSTDANGPADIASYAFKLDGAQVNPTATGTYAASLGAGGHTVLVTVTDKGGLFSTASASITVNNATGNQSPTAMAGVVSLDPKTGRAPVTVTFSSEGSSDPEDNTNLSYHWDFGDGATADVANPTHLYQSVETYSATLTVTDSGGLTATSLVTVAVTGNQAPNADAASATNTRGDAPLTVSFDASQVQDPDGDSFTLTWDFGDDSPLDHSATVSHTYAAQPGKNATLTVEDNGTPTPAKAEKSFTITVTQTPQTPTPIPTPTPQPGDPPNCSLATVTPTSGTPPLKVTLDASQCTPSTGIDFFWRIPTKWVAIEAEQTFSDKTAEYTFPATAGSGDFPIDLRATANGQESIFHFTVKLLPGSGTGADSPSVAPSPFACSAGGGGLFLAGGVLALLPFLRRRRSARGAGAVAALLAAAALVAAAQAQAQSHAKEAPGRIALLPVKAGPGVKPQFAGRATELLAQKLATDLPFAEVLKPADVDHAVGPAKAKRVHVCADARCLADVAKATRADAVLFGSLTKAGKSLTLSLSVFEDRKISRRTIHPLTSQSDDALYGAFDEALKRLFPAPPPPPPAPPVAEVAPPAPEPEPVAAESAVPPATPATPDVTSLDAGVERPRGPGPLRVDARLQIEPSLDKLGLAGMAGYIGVGYAVIPSLALEVGGIVASSYGAELRLSWAPIAITSDGSLRALIRLEGAALLFKPPTGATATGGVSLSDRLALFGAGASVGIEYSPMRVLAFGLEVPVLYLLNAPQLSTANGSLQVSKFFLFAGPFVSLRL
jgi:PKD repeat protein